MSYAASYALFNYTVADPAKGLSEYSNLIDLLSGGMLLKGINDLQDTCNERASLLDHVDVSQGLSEYSNLRLIRSFEKGLDPKSSEAGFILTHVDMQVQARDGC
jgi:hypothetical protein